MSMHRSVKYWVHFWTPKAYTASFSDLVEALKFARWRSKDGALAEIIAVNGDKTDKIQVFNGIVQPSQSSITLIDTAYKQMQRALKELKSDAA